MRFLYIISFLILCSCDVSVDSANSLDLQMQIWLSSAKSSKSEVCAPITKPIELKGIYCLRYKER